MLNTLHNWTIKLQPSINIDKTKVMHCRKQRIKKTDFKFRFGDYDGETVGSYRYLGLDVNETLNYTNGIKTLHNARGER